MASFVVGHQIPLLLRHHSILLLEPDHDALQGVGDVVRVDLGLVLARSHDGALVQQVRQVGARHARRLARHCGEVHARCQRLVLGVHLEDRRTAGHIRRIHLDLPVKSPWPDKRLVQDVCSVRGRKHHHPIVGLEAVHLSEELVHSLFPLVVALAEARTALASHRIDLIDEDDAGSGLLRLSEEVPHTRSTDACEDLHELRGGTAEEGHTSLASYSLGQQSLAGARRADQQRALGDLGAQLGVAFAVLQEVHDLNKLLLSSVAASHVTELGPDIALLHHFCLGLAQLERVLSAHGAAHGAAGAAANGAAEEQDQAGDDPGDGPGKLRQEVQGTAAGVLVLHHHVHLARRKRVEEGVLDGDVGNQIHLVTRSVLVGELGSQHVFLDPHHLHVPLLDLLQEIGVVHLVEGVGRLQGDGVGEEHGGRGARRPAKLCVGRTLEGIAGGGQGLGSCVGHGALSSAELLLRQRREPRHQ
mmetsp:Transcript_75804/g.136752  ORF Transcript_75804/g.136752 Transcript_75804/m.136752 type:complete len:473 (-) Transcript_75804:524-1942(-)